ncbi:GGDEF domain-containing protein [Rhizobium deserti]|uniref:diguanylate cyclase n=1 Tax=Rhizobium deserti TaxID=2547961 RepID=A0A4R5UJH2_9HYPH|nr:GGDEF domain-containing protein [Rhizobium deserti]TDK36996.1 GGDEF domain-containing protein [Rhizobium deserti]
MDIFTGLTVWAVEAITLAILLLSRWFYEREDFYLGWGAGFCLHGLGIILIVLRGEIPDFVSIQIANTMILGGVGAWIAGFLQFDGKPVQGYAAIPALIWIAGMFLNPVRESFAFRTALYNGAAMTGYAIMIGMLLRHSGPSRLTRRVLAGFIAVQFCASGLTGILTVSAQATSFGTTRHAMWLLFPSAFCFVAAIMSGAKLLTERSEEKLRALAVTDPLTGVLNRRGMIEAFHALQKVPSEEPRILALLHFDLDSFKTINDRFGHQAGDAVLIAFSRIGQSSLKARGQFGRMGGEEFASIVCVGDVVEAASIAEAIRMTLKRQPIPFGEHEIRLTVSTGIALSTAEDADLDLLLTEADRGLYAAKQNGRDRTAICSGPDVSVVPAADRPADEEELTIADPNQQVAVLKKLAALGKS